jgi:predicted transglutaminase-like protease
MFCNGKLIDRIIYKTTIISRLVHHRELHLFDGTRLLSKSRYDHVKAVAQLNDTQLADRYVSTSNIYENNFVEKYLQSMNDFG